MAQPLLAILSLFPTLDDPRLSDTFAKLRVFEGYRETVYLDTLGNPTIGYGHKCHINHPAINHDQAEAILSEDIQTAAIAASRVIPHLDSHPMCVRQAMILMAFQMGANRLSGFSAMRKALDRRDYPRAAVEAMASRWAVQTPHRARETAALIAQGANP